MLFTQEDIIPDTRKLQFVTKKPVEILLEYDPPIAGANKIIGYYVSEAANPLSDKF